MIVTIGNATHAGGDLGFRKQSHRQGGLVQGLILARSNGPTDHATREEIKHHRQIEPSESPSTQR
jgi:hypothetical protein